MSAGLLDEGQTGTSGWSLVKNIKLYNIVTGICVRVCVWFKLNTKHCSVQDNQVAIMQVDFRNIQSSINNPHFPYLLFYSILLYFFFISAFLMIKTTLFFRMSKLQHELIILKEYLWVSPNSFTRSQPLKRLFSAGLSSALDFSIVTIKGPNQ